MAFDDFEEVDMDCLANTDGGNLGEGLVATGTALAFGAECAESAAAYAAGTAALATPIGWGALALAAGGVAVYAYFH